MRGRSWSVVCVLIVVMLVSGSASGLMAQGPATPAPTLRAYTHIFIAYGVAWLLVLGWVLRIASKLKQAGRVP